MYTIPKSDMVHFTYTARRKVLTTIMHSMVKTPGAYLCTYGSAKGLKHKHKHAEFMGSKETGTGRAKLATYNTQAHIHIIVVQSDSQSQHV